MMGINFRILLPFLLFYDIEVSSAQTVQDVVTYTRKPVEELKCQFSTSITVQWIENQDGGGTIVLFSYVSTTGRANKEATDEKYNNFDFLIDQESNSFNLLITNVDKDDDGRYVCTPFSEPAVTFDVSVEVIPASISIHCTASNACTSSAERKVAAQIVCVCMATGLSSKMLKIEWEGVDAPTISNVSNVTDPTSRTISIGSEITLLTQDANSSISCLLTGYKSQIPKGLRSDTYTFSPPVCSLVHECPSDGTSAVLICSCTDELPKISAYSFNNSQMSLTGTQFYNSSTLKVEVDGEDTFSCSGCNGVRNSQTAEHTFSCQQGSALWIFIIIVGIMLLLVVAAIIFLVMKKRMKKCNSIKITVPVKPEPTPKVESEEKVPLYENTAAQEHQKLQDPRGIKPDVSISGDPATKDKDKGIKPDVSTSGDPATKDKDKGKTVPSNEAQTKPTGSEEVPNTTTSNEGEDEGRTGPSNEAPTTESTGNEEVPNMKTPNKEISKEGEDTQVKGETDVSQQDDHNGDSGDNALHSNRGEGNPASTVRPPPEGQETTVNGQSERDVGSEVDHGKRQSEKVVGSHVDSGKWEVDTTETSGGNQPTSHPAPSAKQEKTTPHNQGTRPAYSAATQNNAGRQGGNNDISLSTYMRSPEFTNC